MISIKVTRPFLKEIAKVLRKLGNWLFVNREIKNSFKIKPNIRFCEAAQSKENLRLYKVSAYKLLFIKEDNG